MIVKCNMTDCIYNSHGLCEAGTIELTDFRSGHHKYGHSMCQTFVHNDDKELAICGDCDTYEVCPLIGHEDRQECEKIKAGRGEGK